MHSNMKHSSKNFLQIVTEITFYYAFHFKSFLEKEAKFYFKNDDWDRDIINPTRKRKKSCMIIFFKCSDGTFHIYLLHKHAIQLWMFFNFRGNREFCTVKNRSYQQLVAGTKRLPIGREINL